MFSNCATLLKQLTYFIGVAIAEHETEGKYWLQQYFKVMEIREKDYLCIIVLKFIPLC